MLKRIDKIKEINPQGSVDSKEEINTPKVVNETTIKIDEIIKTVNQLVDVANQIIDTMNALTGEVD